MIYRITFRMNQTYLSHTVNGSLDQALGCVKDLSEVMFTCDHPEDCHIIFTRLVDSVQGKQ